MVKENIREVKGMCWAVRNEGDVGDVGDGGDEGDE